MPSDLGNKMLGAAVGAAPGLAAGQPSMALSGGINGFRAGGVPLKGIVSSGSLTQGAKAGNPATPPPPVNPTTNPIFAPSRRPQPAPASKPGVVSRFLGKSAACPDSDPATILASLRAKAAQFPPEGVHEAPQYEGTTNDAARALALLAGLGGVSGLGIGAVGGAINAPPRHRLEGAFRGAHRAKNVMGGGALGALGGAALGGIAASHIPGIGVDNGIIGGGALGGLAGARAGWSLYDWENPQPTWER